LSVYVLFLPKNTAAKQLLLGPMAEVEALSLAHTQSNIQLHLRMQQCGSCDMHSVHCVLAAMELGTAGSDIITPRVIVASYLRQIERSEHWRRLRDWSFCPYVCT